MRLDEFFYKKQIGFFEKNINKIFGCDMIVLSKQYNFENRGFFKLSYHYLPHNYKIEIENEIKTFDINIENKNMASNSLYRIKSFDNSLDEKNIIASLLLLKDVLEQNNFYWYYRKNNKLYRKKDDKIKRVRSIKDILNG